MSRGTKNTDKSSVPDLADRQCGARARGASGEELGKSSGKNYSLRVLPDDAKLRKSRMGWKRATVLTLVNVLMIVHFLQWYFAGMSGGEVRTIAPLEPSESMSAIELGKVNAGIIVFGVGLLTTFLFGRFFCGWGCHIVALQDLCTWFMKKLGIHPKPFRTRLLLLMPLLMGSYMFVWPTFKREVVKPIVTSAWGADAYEHLAPFIGDAAPRPLFRAQFTVEDLWATMPPWEVAVPFLFICGFATVYFLGSKGFCTYGCPYGGFFAPVDEVSIGKIVVNDNCEQCGHCTATCTSNVRVHEEVRDYGMVVDPGCMKCLDCVSVCPNDALSLKIAKPAIFKKAVTPQAKERRAKHRIHYDLTIAEEIWVGFVFLVFTWFGFRGMLNSVPLLMSAGLGAIAAFTTWKLVRLVRTPNVRLGHLQLRIKGRVTGWGVAFVPLAIGLFALGAWGTLVRGYREVGSYWDYQVLASDAFSPGYVPEPHEKEKAQAAIQCLRRGDSPEFGGIGWSLKTGDVSRLAWLYAVSGDKDNCVRMQERVVSLIRSDVNQTRLKNTRAERNVNLADGLLRLADFYAYRGDLPQKAADLLKQSATGEEGLGALHLRVAYNEFQRTQDANQAEKAIREAVALDRRVREHADTVLQGAHLLEAIGRQPLGRGLFEDEIEHSKWADHVRVAFGRYLAALGQVESAKEQFRLAAKDRVEAEQAWAGEAQVLLSQNRAADAIKVLEPAIKQRPRSTMLVSSYARALQMAGRTPEAAKQLRRWSELDPRDQTPWISLAALERSRGGSGADKAALEALIEGERHRNDDAIMLLTVGEELLKARRTPEALERFRKAVALPPRNPQIRARAKELLINAGMTKEADSL